ncbi:hypothetical protein ACIQNU_04080 [Streptomyces sp. NPDC091292]|uniref:hypothetical protein n=1 Tax=Streptomyces sp. NPDC091292 TaxID=3365991 RepID=UPI0037F98491
MTDMPALTHHSLETTVTDRLTDQQQTPAEIRLAQYGERTSTWSTATYNDGTEKALHEIALGLKTEIDRLREQRRYLIDQLTKKDTASGAGDRALREFLGGKPAAEPDIAAADNPTPLHWGLNDVLWGDDDTVTVLLSGPAREPYWLELDPERAAVLREDLAGPAAEEAHVVADGSAAPDSVEDCPGCVKAVQG